MDIIRDKDQRLSYIKIDGIFVPVEHYKKQQAGGWIKNACALAVMVVGILIFLQF